MTICESHICSSDADVTVEQVDGPSICVCWRHLIRMLLSGSHEIRAFRRLGWEPKCFQPACDETSVAVARNKDDLPLPACVSWVGLPGPLMPDEPGWSRG